MQASTIETVKFKKIERLFLCGCLTAGGFAEVAVAAPEVANANKGGIVSVLLNLTAMGSSWVLWLLIALSIASLAVIAERAHFFHKHRTNLLELTTKLHEKLSVGDWSGAAEICSMNKSFEARVAARAIELRDCSAEATEKTLDGFVAAHRRYLDQGLTFLGTLGNNAPFIGLFGTVLGIIDAFHALAANPAGGAGVVMSGISEALVTTAVGLAVAIPAVIAFNTFQRLVKTKLESAQAVQGLVLGHAVMRADAKNKQAA